MLNGAIGDDVTRSGDLANMVARAGVSVQLRTGIPNAARGDGPDAVVTALKTRTLPVADAVAQSLAALHWVHAQRAGRILFSYCSTFVSTRQGNIGPMPRMLADALGMPSSAGCCSTATPAQIAATRCGRC